MVILKGIVVLGWIIWIALYWHLTWTNRFEKGRVFLKMGLPVYLFLSDIWPSETKEHRSRLKRLALLMIIATVMVEGVTQ
jgi:hypothetical protein